MRIDDILTAEESYHLMGDRWNRAAISSRRSVGVPISTSTILSRAFSLLGTRFEV